LSTCPGCGKETDAPSGTCPGCGKDAPVSIGPALPPLPTRGRKALRNHHNRWLVLSMLAVATVIFGAAASIAFSIPTGRDFEVKARASICRSNLRSVSEAVEDYRQDNGEYPTEGRLDSDHPLMVDRYLEDPPRCPETGRHYVLKFDEAGASASCDSGLKSHVLR